MSLQRVNIDQGWCFKDSKDPNSAYLPVAQFPSSIHLDLQHHGKIPDPFLDRNESQVQWVGEEEWSYRTSFQAPPKDSRRRSRAELVFEGIDTCATIYLNGTAIQKTDNMFIAYRVDVTDQLREDNELRLEFESTWRVGKLLEQNAEQKPLFCFNGDSSRLQVRKAQYHYGWDWGPTFLTCGPWRPIYLEIFQARISELTIKVDVHDSLSSARVYVSAEVTGPEHQLSVKFELLEPGGKLIAEQTTTPDQSSSTLAKFDLTNPQLWYPNGNGAQPLYAVRVSCLCLRDSSALCTSVKRFGVRRVELVQRSLDEQPGTTFFFRINNLPIFCRGSDWIPADSFLPRITIEKYRRCVSLAAAGNQNMIRIWGGGIYEDEAFYDACDESGIMIWQDFMLACGAYPATTEFLKQIEAEAVFNVKRLRHHPSIVLWCGNNEDHMFADRFPDAYNPDDHNPENWLKTKWPGRIIYDKILKEICAKHHPEVPYHPGSPWGGRPSNDPTAGDTHSWGVWMKALEQYPYQYYPKLSGRFVSEFGVKSWPCVKTLESFITEPGERFPQSRTMDAHSKSASQTPWAGDHRNLALYMWENVRYGRSLGQFTYASQLVQAEAMTFAFAGWRRLWRGPGREECSGALVWQFNDCWPVMSWSLLDYHLRPKLAYYTVKRALSPISVGVSRDEIELSRRDPVTRVHIDKELQMTVWGSNLTTTPHSVTLLLQIFHIRTGHLLWSKTTSVDLPANQSTDLLTIPYPIPSPEDSIVAARLLDPIAHQTLSRFADWPQPLRYLDLPRPHIDVRVDGDEVRISSELPVKGVELRIDDDGVMWEDNCLDLMPGDERVIHVHNLRGRTVGLMHLGIAE